LRCRARARKGHRRSAVPRLRAVAAPAPPDAAALGGALAPANGEGGGCGRSGDDACWRILWKENEETFIDVGVNSTCVLDVRFTVERVFDVIFSVENTFRCYRW
jgi:hypothetical protein